MGYRTALSEETPTPDGNDESPTVIEEEAEDDSDEVYEVPSTWKEIVVRRLKKGWRATKSMWRIYLVTYIAMFLLSFAWIVPCLNCMSPGLYCSFFSYTPSECTITSFGYETDSLTNDCGFVQENYFISMTALVLVSVNTSSTGTVNSTYDGTSYPLATVCTSTQPCEVSDGHGCQMTDCDIYDYTKWWSHCSEIVTTDLEPYSSMLNSTVSCYYAVDDDDNYSVFLEELECWTSKSVNCTIVLFVLSFLALIWPLLFIPLLFYEDDIMRSRTWFGILYKQMASCCRYNYISTNYYPLNDYTQ